VLIIDNITYLRSETEQAKDASILMKMLNTLKKKYSLSMLVLAHTPKRDQSRPIETNHLQGSKVIANLTDGIIAIGKSSRDHGMRYIKQLKGRLGEKNYEDDNVCLCEIVKPHDFLHFRLLGHCPERDHLKEVSDKELGHRLASVKDMHAQGMSQREIANALSISVGSVNRYLKK
jgi:ATP/maltotriose-dependent transcriptional regulator MalT